MGKCRYVQRTHEHISAPARGIVGFHEILDIFEDKKQQIQLKPIITHMLDFVIIVLYSLLAVYRIVAIDAIMIS